jgi:hypothetical protein
MLFASVQFLTDFESSVYVDEAAHLLSSIIVPNSFQTVSENLEQIAADASNYYTSLNANRVKCEQSEKFKG